jgi:hypothetical protein
MMGQDSAQLAREKGQTCPIQMKRKSCLNVGEVKQMIKEKI